MEQPRILVVDDELSICHLCRTILEKKNYNVSTARGVPEAKEMLQKQPFELLITDLNMPGESGFDLISYAQQHHPHTAVTIISSIYEDDAAQSLLGSGVYDYIVKPIDRNQLIISAENALRRRKLEIEKETFEKRLEQLVIERTQKLNETIEQLQNTQSRLDESQARFKSFFENSQDALYIRMRDGKLVEINQAMAEMLGYTMEEMKVIGISQLYFNPADRPAYEAAVEKDGSVKEHALTLKKKDGRAVYTQISGSVIRNNKGKPIGYQGAIRDITEQRRLEKELLEAHKENELLITSVPSIFIGVSETHTITKWNRVARETFGLNTSRVLGQALETLPVDWDSRRIRSSAEKCLSRNRRVRVDDVSFKRPDGKGGVLGLNMSPLRGADNQPCGYLVMGAEITERKQLETQLAHAQKLESIGQLAAGVAHEINTPIQYVGDNTRFIKEAFGDIKVLLDKYDAILAQLDPNAPFGPKFAAVRDHIEEIDLTYLMEELPTAIEQNLEGVARVSKIVLAMKEFSHPGTKEKKSVDINKAIESIITVSRNEWKYVADLQTHLAPDLPRVPCLPDEINQVFLNLIVNAAHAIAEKNSAEDKGLIAISTSQEDNWVHVRIADTGMGIPEEIRDRIFDPFFTTKEVGRGTGQGLSISHAIITEKHAGRIRFETQIGHGTAFYIELPMDS